MRKSKLNNQRELIMNKNILIAALAFFLVTTALISQQTAGTGFNLAAHDSLLFDGSNIISIAGDEYLCRISVEKVQGKVTGTRMFDKLVSECGGDPQKMIEYKKEQIQPGDFLKPGDEISTGPDGTATITLIDGKEIFIYPNTTFTVGRSYDYCKSEDIPVTVKKGGQLLIDARRGDRNKVLEIQTDRSKVYVKGTVFSVFSQDGGDSLDIVKTYEGVVEVYAGKIYTAPISDAAAEITKLSDDLQNKRITMEEYNAKMMELQTKIEKSTEELSIKKINLTAGFKCTINSDGKISEPEAFDTNDDANFKK